MIKDSTGRKIRKGDLVDVPMNGMFKANIIELQEPLLVDVPGAQKEPPFVIFQVMMKIYADPRTGLLPNAYMIQQAQGSLHPFASHGQQEGEGAQEESGEKSIH